jgi:hypothetical protein
LEYCREIDREGLVEWFRTENTHLFLRKSEGLYKSGAETERQKVMDGFCQVYAELIAEFLFIGRPENI